jgi:hypothetical protein
MENCSTTATFGTIRTLAPAEAVAGLRVDPY